MTRKYSLWLYKSGPFLVMAGGIYYFRDYLKYHTYQRFYAWIMNRDGDGINESLGSEKAEIFDHLTKLKSRLNRNLLLLEIGAGAAPNLKYFPKDSKVVCLEPNPHFNKYIETSITKSQDTVSEVTIMNGYVENLDMKDETFDAVVCTLVLCSVRDPTKSLSEIKRVLKPGGMFLFLEHVGAEKGTSLRSAQRWINPVWRIIGDGCETIRDTGDQINQAGFTSVSIRKFRTDKFRVPFFLKPCILGVAVK